MSSTQVTPADAPKAVTPRLRLFLLDYHSAVTCMLVSGQSSREYTFVFDKALQLFIYDATQDEANDLIRTNGFYDFFKITALVPAPAVPSDPAAHESEEIDRLKEALAKCDKALAERQAFIDDITKIAACPPGIPLQEVISDLRRDLTAATEEIARMNKIADGLRRGASANAERENGLRARVKQLEKAIKKAGVDLPKAEEKPSDAAAETPPETPPPAG